MSKLKKQIDNNVVLSLPENTFADMIVNFLGKKEKLSYKKKTYFILNLNDITQFYYLLDEKIKKEQFTHLNYFSLIVNYDDSTSREINTIERLKIFHETRNVIPISISMSWNIILKFPNSETIENQKINLLFNITDEVIDGNVSLNIQHTNPAWGVEVLNLFTDNIKKVSIQESKSIGVISLLTEGLSRKALLKAYIFILVIFISVLFSFTLTGYENKTRSYSSGKVQLVNKIYDLSYSNALDDRELKIALNAITYMRDQDIEELSNKGVFGKNISPSIEIYLLESKTKYSKFLKFFLGILMIISFLYFFGKYYYNSYINFYKNSSVINITEAANKKQQAFNEGKNKAVFYSLSLIVFSILCSFIASVIFSVINK